MKKQLLIALMFVATISNAQMEFQTTKYSYKDMQDTANSFRNIPCSDIFTIGRDFDHIIWKHKNWYKLYEVQSFAQNKYGDFEFVIVDINKENDQTPIIFIINLKTYDIALIMPYKYYTYYCEN